MVTEERQAKHETAGEIQVEWVKACYEGAGEGTAGRGRSGGEGRRGGVRVVIGGGVAPAARAQRAQQRAELLCMAGSSRQAWQAWQEEGMGERGGKC